MSYGYDVRPAAASQAQDSSPDTSTSKTLVPPTGASGCLLSAETTDARVTFNGTVPAANNGMLLKAGQQPLFLPFAKTVTWRSSAGTAAVVNATWLS